MSYTFSLTEIVQYGLMLIVFGASVYTFFMAMPELRDLQKETKDLQGLTLVLQERIEQLSSRAEGLEDAYHYRTSLLHDVLRAQAKK